MLPVVEIIRTGWFVDCEERSQSHYIEVRFPSGSVVQLAVDEEAFAKIVDELAALGDSAPAPSGHDDDLTPDPDPDRELDEDGIPPSE